MLRKTLFAALIVAAPLAAAAPAFAADAPAPAPALTVEATSIGDLLDNPQAKAVLEKHIPEMIANPQFEMARGMTLKQIQGFAGDALSDDKLAAINAELAKLAAK